MPDKPTKPLIEDVINEVLTGEAQANALNFVAYLRENKMTPSWFAANAWKVTFRSFTVCFIRLHGTAHYHNLGAGEWHIVPFIGEYDGDALAEEYKEIAWANKRTCTACGQCALKLDTVFGKKYDYACEGAILFINPNAEAVECAKKLVELRREAVKAGIAKKHVYVPMKDR